MKPSRFKKLPILKSLFALFLSLLFSGALGCANTPIEGDGLDQTQKALLEKHRQALSKKKQQPTEACSTFQSLANDSTYILKELAVLRAGAVCPDMKSIPALTTAEESIVSHSPWLLNLNLERKTHIASIRNNQSDPALRELLNAYVNQVQITNSTQEKLNLLQELKIQVASDLGLTEDVQNRIYQIAPRTNPSPKDLNKAAQDAFKNQDYDLGREFLEKIFDNSLLSFSERLQARKNHRNSFRIEREFEGYYEDCQEYANWIKKNFWTYHNFDWKIFYESQFVLAKAAYMIGNAEEAERVLKRAAETIKGRTSLEELYWFRGRLAEERKDYRAALDFFNSSLLESSEKPHFRERVLFSQAWVYRKMKHFKDAVSVLTGLRDRTKESNELSRYTYWLGRNLIDFNRTNEGRAELERVKLMDPFGFFGIAATLLLKEEFPAFTEANKKIATTPLELTLRQNISAFSLANENGVLELYLNTKLRNNAKIPEVNTISFLLEKLSDAEFFGSLLTQVNELTPKLNRTILGNHPEYAFPIAYNEIVRSSAAHFQIPQELIYATIRFHSGFVPDAQPSSGGAGLAGLTDELATEYASATGVKYQGVDDLYNPEVSIKLLSARLGSLKTLYKNQTFLMGLGLFATPQNITHWIKTRQGSDAMEFIEDIPLEDFQYNIRTLMRNFIFYSRILNGEKTYQAPKDLFQIADP